MVRRISNFIRSDAALLELGLYLRRTGYQFTTVTPETHRIVLARDPKVHTADPLRDLFGFSRAVDAAKIPVEVLDLMTVAEILREHEGTVQSTVRFSCLGSSFYIHSAYPTNENSSVFFGPDSYRFVRFANAQVKSANVIADIGCGTGVGGIELSKCLQIRRHAVKQLYLTDINAAALGMAAVNAELNETPAHVFESDLMKSLPPDADTILANPPFIMDHSKRAYRHGGNDYGTDLSVRIAEEALEYLPKAGQLIMYTGAPVVEGKDLLRWQLRSLLESPRLHCTYEELDPDIFGEELASGPYAKVERLAAVGLVVVKM